MENKKYSFLEFPPSLENFINFIYKMEKKNKTRKLQHIWRQLTHTYNFYTKKNKQKVIVSYNDFKVFFFLVVFFYLKNYIFI